MRARAVALALLALSTRARGDELVVATDGGEPGPGAGVKTQVAVGCMRPGARCEDPKSSHEVAGLFGIRGGETAVHGRDTKAGVSLHSVSTSYVTSRRGGVSARAGHFAFIGGGRGGMEGGLGLDVGFGLYHAVGDGHGPFSRLGGRGFLLGNPVFFASLVELPQLQLGYQLLRRDLHLELGARGGPVLAGRVNPDDERRRLGGSFEWGGHLAVGAGPLNLGIELSHVEPGENDPQGGVDILSALLCGGAGYLGACFDARLFRAASEERREPIRTVLFGVTLGSHTAEPRPGH
ncbi:MAG: hypothetical protein IPM35_02955 [Myxococcales bacterium]|nr:hypothetical protein [Myxococcales bacterium]